MPVTLRRTAGGVVALGAIGLVAAVLPASPAQGWGNGGDRAGAGKTVRNGYGTHDWVVDQAYRIAGGKSKVGSWFDPGTAKQWSGYPDVYRRKTEHVFMETGHGRGAAQQASDYYVKAVQAYRGRDYRAASKWFGIMSHFVADVSMPYHTKQFSGNNRPEAEKYEKYTTSLTHGTSAAHSLCPQPSALPRVTDVRRAISSIAASSRGYYSTLSSRLRSSNWRTSTVPITAKLLPLTCNNLAALLLSVPRASALPARVARVKAKLVRTKVRVGLSPKVDVSAFDAQGRRLDGVEFGVDWPGTTHDTRLYTLPNQDKRNGGAVARSATGKARVYVTVLDPAAALSGSSSAAAASTRVVVAKKYRVMTTAQLKKARHKARQAGKPWKP